MENTFYLDDGVPYAVRCYDGHVCIDKTNAIARIFRIAGRLPVAVTTPEYMKYLYRMSLNSDLNKKLSQNIEAIAKSGDPCNAILLVKSGPHVVSEIRTTETPIWVLSVDENELSSDLVREFPRRVA